MRHLLLCTTLLLAPLAARAATLEELEAAKEAAAQRAREAGEIDLGGGEDTATGGPGGETTTPGNPCKGGGGGDGEMSLLGVKSDYKRPGAGGPPVTRLDPQSPLMQRLSDMGSQMGFYRDPEGATPEMVAQNAAARERKALHDTYAQFAAYGESGTAYGGTPMADLFGWVYDGKMEQMAQAYAEYEEMARQYAELYQEAETAGKACP